MYEGTWVKVNHYGRRFTGYIEEVRNDEYIIHVVLPGNKFKLIPFSKIFPIEVVQCEEPTSVEQIEFLIDYALQIKDKQWFMELSEQLNQCKSNLNNGKPR